jgi:type II secretory pathway pseudopilin PulG
MIFSASQQSSQSRWLSHGGFTLVEVVVAAAMITVSFVAIAMYYKKVLDVSEDTTRHIQSGFLLEEGLEAVKLLRDEGWNANIGSLSTTTNYYLTWSGTFWRTTTVPIKVENIFTRTIKFSDVRRDGVDSIAAAGTLDSGTKKVTVAVTWLVRGGSGMATDTAETYVTNLFSN